MEVRHKSRFSKELTVFQGVIETIQSTTPLLYHHKYTRLREEVTLLPVLLTLETLREENNKDLKIEHHALNVLTREVDFIRMFQKMGLVKPETDCKLNLAIEDNRLVCTLSEQYYEDTVITFDVPLEELDPKAKKEREQMPNVTTFIGIKISR